MDQLLSLRREVHDHFHASTIREDLFLVPGNRDRFAQYETAMLLMQDTGAALREHRRRDFSTSMVGYIEVWGVMQAVFIQQDSLLELAAALGAPKPVTGTAWETIRDFRNLLAGHPINKRSPNKTPLRAFMGRQQKSYRELTYELWDAAADRTTFPQVDLGAMLDAYENEAADHLTSLLSHMRLVWPAPTTAD
ncbi:hypothetical protein [Phenylobacterium sp.]|uniref:hypothetical protein n=1 Tax=Phenylobacterium sp. TaxID=1871053 RepID=UPI002FC6C7D6